MINVKDSPYRATGNGIADDTAAIQAALNVGDTYLPAGRYNVRKPLHWTAPNVWLHGDGGTKINAMAGFQGEAVVLIGQPTGNPTYRAGIRNISVDLSDCPVPGLIGVHLVQCWFAHVEALKIFSPNGLAQARQTAFQIHGGAAAKNWAANNNIYDLQIAGSFQIAVRHISAPGAMVNGSNYFGGFAYGNATGKKGTSGFRIEDNAGDSTRVYGFALEDFDLGVYVGSQNNGPLDFRIEDCATPYAVAPGITFTVVNGPNGLPVRFPYGG